MFHTNNDKHIRFWFLSKKYNNYDCFKHILFKTIILSQNIFVYKTLFLRICFLLKYITYVKSMFPAIYFIRRIMAPCN